MALLQPRLLGVTLVLIHLQVRIHARKILVLHEVLNFFALETLALAQVIIDEHLYLGSLVIGHPALLRHCVLRVLTYHLRG